MKRITTIDVTRGLVMVIMALDHVRDLLHLPALTQDPTDLSTTTAPLFLTRWVTHLCAPTFVFLSGTSVYLSLKKQRELGQVGDVGWLLKRGLVLIALELTLINVAIWGDVQLRMLMLQVIFAIGGGLVLLSMLVRLPLRWLAAVGFVIIFGHDLLLLVPGFSNLGGRLGWSLLFKTDFFSLTPNFSLLVAYPLIPWFGMMLVGFACGPVFTRPLPERQKRLLLFGLPSLGLFIGLRFINIYGDANPWATQKNTLFTVLSFLNVSKYPPSLLYTAVTLGIACLLLWAADGADNAVTRVLTVYGKVPLFYYLVHWYLVRLSLIGMALLQGYSLNDPAIGPQSFGRPPGAGVSLPAVYGVWMALVVLLYPLCRWYGRYKANHPEIGWLRYL